MSSRCNQCIDVPCPLVRGGEPCSHEINADLCKLVHRNPCPPVLCKQLAHPGDRRKISRPRELPSYSSPSAMEARLLRRPVATLFSGHSQFLLALNAASSRHESSYRRSRSRLNVKPEPSFLPSYSKAPVQQDHIIFNPPSSAPSVLHTPLSFLPKEDKRKQLLVATAKKFSSSTPMRLPPPIRTKPKVPHHHLSDADIAEILKLKHQDPDHWTNAKLARKFNCSSLFISICLTQCTADNTKRKLELKQKKEAIEARWGPRRRKAREEQERRFQLAYRGA